MPTISSFFSIKIFMNWNDHKPPHFHAKYNNYSAAFDLDGNVIAGYLPIKEKRLVLAWLELHREELNDNWLRAEKKEELCKIEPLKK